MFITYAALAVVVLTLIFSDSIAGGPGTLLMIAASMAGRGVISYTESRPPLR